MSSPLGKFPPQFFGCNWEILTASPTEVSSSAPLPQSESAGPSVPGAWVVASLQLNFSFPTLPSSLSFQGISWKTCSSADHLSPFPQNTDETTATSRERTLTYNHGDLICMSPGNKYLSTGGGWSKDIPGVCSSAIVKTELE